MSENRFLSLKPKANSHVFRSRKKKLTRKAVLKMLAVMEASQAGTSNAAENAIPPGEKNAHSQEFLSSGRTGRRNALPDILGQHAVVTSSDLPAKLQSLSTSDRSADVQTDQPSTSSGKS